MAFIIKVMFVLLVTHCALLVLEEAQVLVLPATQDIIFIKIHAITPALQKPINKLEIVLTVTSLVKNAREVQQILVLSARIQDFCINFSVF